MIIKIRLVMVLAFVLAVGMLTACGNGSKNDTSVGAEEVDAIELDAKEPDKAQAEVEKPEAVEDTEAAEPGEDTEKSGDNALEETVGQYIEQMTVEEKAAQLFIILPESLMKDVDTVMAAGETTKKAIEQTPVGGFIYLDGNLSSRDQVKTMLENVQKYSMDRIKLPMFLCIDEEGGAVARIGKSGKFDVPKIEDMSVIGARENTDEAYEAGKIIGTYLSDMGFNVDFAPVADVLTNPDNEVVKNRAFGSDAVLVSSMAAAVAKGLEEKNICAVYKHFPGHGGTAADTHEGYAYVDKDLETLQKEDLLPFEYAISNGVKMIMVGHISLPKVTGNDTPASVSPEIVTDLLREELLYDGVVVTDALNMGAVTKQYTSAKAAVQTILAGSDLILMPENFEEAYQGVLAAIKDGTISEERLHESLRRILRIKIKMMNY